MRNISILFLASLFYSCANIVAPTGGEKDIEPPIPIVVIPENKTTNFNRETIIFSFDEFIQLNNPKNQVIISPALDQTPTFNIKKRTLLIEFNSPLRENTTYTINFGDAIRDLNEGNVLSNFTYVFSTGDYLDSARVSGSTIEAQSGQPVSDITVALYKGINDSIIFNEKPYYFTRSTKEGNFTINNIKEDYYKVVAFHDQNSNLTYDINETIGFLKDSILINDTTFDITFYMFKEDIKGKVNNAYSSGLGKIQLVALNPIDTGTIALSVDFSTIEVSKNMDSLTYWLSDYNIDSVKVLIDGRAQKDTFNVRIARGTDSMGYFYPFPLTLTSIKDTLIDLGLPIILKAPIPLKEMKKDLIKVLEDSIKIDPIFLLDNRKLIIKYDWKEKKNYSLIIPDGTIQNIYGKNNLQYQQEFIAKSKEEYGTLVIKAKLLMDQQYVLQLFSGRNNQLILQKVLNDRNSVKIENLIPGNYTLRIILDTNENEKWDPGNYLIGKQPEKVISYPSSITIKNNWETEIEVIID